MQAFPELLDAVWTISRERPAFPNCCLLSRLFIVAETILLWKQRFLRTKMHTGGTSFAVVRTL